MIEYDDEKRKLYFEIGGLESKLQKYKDIEDKLGVDLITVFKALENGLYWKNNHGEITFQRQDLENAIALSSFNGEMYFQFFKVRSYNKHESIGSVCIQDYRYEWALERNELL